MTPSLRSLLLGLSVGDALGVPYEFLTRGELDANPCVGMRGWGTHNQPPGTWSDDTSMALVLTDALARGSSLEDLASGWLRWAKNAEWTANGIVFDIGGGTSNALGAFARTGDPRTSGGQDESSNGNGSLMRTAPLACFLDGTNREQRRVRTFEISGVTHAHPRSQLGCWLLVEILRLLLSGADLATAVDQAWLTVDGWASVHEPSEWLQYRSCRSSLSKRDRSSISSSGYVVHTLEAALWCLLTSATYTESVLKAVNLGSDTDTTGAVAGALAGVAYGEAAIPQGWLDVLARRTDIERLCR